MKKLLLIPVLLFSLHATAQTAEPKSIAIIQYVAGLSCPPCGKYGHSLTAKMKMDNTPKAATFSCYPSPGDAYYVKVAWDITRWMNSVPSYAVNHKAYNKGSGAIIDTIVTRTMVKNIVDSFAATSPVASTGYNIALSGNILTVNTTTKFWQPASGDFYLSAYIIEDNISGPQAGAVGNVIHHDVLRAGMTDSSFGERIANGSISMNQTYKKSFSFTIVDGTWVKSNLSVIVVLWKKNGVKYDFVNANNIPQKTTPVESTEAVHKLSIFPNPANESITINGTLLSSAGATLTLTNATGQIVHSEKIQQSNGFLYKKIDVASLSPGLYIINVTTENSKTTGKVIIRR